MTEVLVCYLIYYSLGNPSNKPLWLPWATLPSVVYLVLMYYSFLYVCGKIKK